MGGSWHEGGGSFVGGGMKVEVDLDDLRHVVAMADVAYYAAEEVLGLYPGDRPEYATERNESMHRIWRVVIEGTKLERERLGGGHEGERRRGVNKNYVETCDTPEEAAAFEAGVRDGRAGKPPNDCTYLANA